ncbi:MULTISPECIES: hypothetical protein [unclassified Thermococcus]|uniref:hypothetical protein n=1 Tax=unclassified Thermococcus TaxID=2627626 RepID=UPI001F11895D|nr:MULTISPECIES: hypothetical protein [unclassified Thermococcus]
MALIIIGRMSDGALIVDEGTVTKATHEFPRISRRTSIMIKILALALLLCIILNFRVEVVMGK